MKGLLDDPETESVEFIENLARACYKTDALRNLRTLCGQISALAQPRRDACVVQASRWVTRSCLQNCVPLNMLNTDIRFLDALGVLIFKGENAEAVFDSDVFSNVPALSALKHSFSSSAGPGALSSIVVDFFWWAVLERKLGDISIVSRLVSDAAPSEWSRRIFHTFVSLSAQIAELLPASPREALDIFKTELSALEFSMQPPGDHDYISERVIRSSIVLIVYDFHLLARVSDPGLRADRETFEWLFDLPFSWLETTLTGLEQIRASWLSDAACAVVCQRADANLEICQEYPERTATAARVSLILARNGSNELAKAWLEKWAENILAHGGHKDLLLMEAVECTRLLIEQTDIHPENHLSRLRALGDSVSSVGQFTDGKETRAIPPEFMECLALADPELKWLRRYRQHLLYKDEHYRAEQALNLFLQKSDLGSTANQAVAAGAIAEEDIVVILERVEDGDEGAGKVVELIDQAIGTDSAQKSLGFKGKKATESDSNIAMEKVEDPDFTQFPPREICSLLSRFRDKLFYREKQRVLVGWAEHWIGIASPEEVRSALLNAKSHYPDVRIGLALWNIAVKFPDISNRFESLVTWMKEEGGWGHYWVDGKEAKRIIEIVSKEFPERIGEFVLASLPGGSAVENRWSLSHAHWFRIVEAFLASGKLELAEAFTDQAVETAREFCEVQKLTSVQWEFTEDEIDPGDLWMCAVLRLEDPQFSARERSATVLGKAIADGNDTALSALKKWLCRQSVSIFVTNGLLVLAKALECGRKWTPMELRQIFDSLGCRSISAWMVARALNRDVAGAITEWVNTREDSRETTISSRDHSFLTEAPYYVPPRFIERVRSLPEPVQDLFSSRWYEEFAKLLGKVPDRFSDKSLRELWDLDHKNQRRFGAIPRSTDLCRSAFEIAVSWAFGCGFIDQDTAIDWVRLNVPIDLDLWKIPPKPTPDWWPACVQSAGENFTKVPSPLWDFLEKWCKTNDPCNSEEVWISAGISGFLDDGMIQYTIHCHAAIQHVTDGQIPIAEGVVRGARGPIIKVDQIDRIRLEGSLPNIDVRHIITRSGGWLITPIVGGCGIKTTNAWQPWRILRPPQIILPWFSPTRCKLVIKDGYLETHWNNRPIAKWNDWTAGLQEKVDQDNPITRCGSRIDCRREWAAELLEVQKANWIWGVEIIAHVPDQYDTRRENAHFFRSIGGSMIIS